MSEPSDRMQVSGRGRVAFGRGTRYGLLFGLALGVGAGCAQPDQSSPPPPSDATAVAREDPLNPGQPLHCSGIESLDPAEATIALDRLGWRVSYRWVYSTGIDTGYGVALVAPPRGVITGMVYGDPGWLVMMVSPPNDHLNRRIPAPLDCPTN